MEAELKYLICITLVIMSQIFSTNTQPTVKITAPLNPVESGGVLGVHCQVWNLNSNHEVTILRTVGGEIQRLTQDHGVTHSAEDRVFLAPRQLDDGSMVYFLSIMEVNRFDEGEYACRIVSKKLEASVNSDSLIINVEYFPGESDPTCSPSEPITVFEGTPLTFNCTSEEAYPLVSLTWNRVGIPSENLQTDEGLTDGLIYSSITLRALRDYNEAVFLCEISSVAFPTKTHSCHVGPIKVIPDKNINHDMVTQAPNDIKINELISVKPGHTINDVSEKAGNQIQCSELCSTLSTSSDAFVWIVATIAGTSLALIFFVVGIYLLIKYCRLQPEPQPRYMAVQQPYHGIYAELDGRRNEGKVYMTLEQADKRTHDKVNGHYDVMPHLPKL